MYNNDVINITIRLNRPASNPSSLTFTYVTRNVYLRKNGRLSFLKGKRHFAVSVAKGRIRPTAGVLGTPAARVATRRSGSLASSNSSNNRLPARFNSSSSNSNKWWTISPPACTSFHHRLPSQFLARTRITKATARPWAIRICSTTTLAARAATTRGTSIISCSIIFRSALMAPMVWSILPLLCHRHRLAALNRRVSWITCNTIRR